MLITKMMKNIPLMFASSITLMMVPASVGAVEHEMNQSQPQPMVAYQFIEKAKTNPYWKVAFATGEAEQIVFMNISPQTNPSNEIGEEVHSFDQAILVVLGEGKAVLDEKASLVKEGDLIFIPRGTVHNVMNMSPKNELKIISFYSDTDVPAGTVYKTIADEPKS